VQPTAHFLLLQFQRPGDGWSWPVAILLFDPSNDKLHVRGREDYASIADADDALVLAETVKQLQADARAQSGSAILELLESTLSNSVRMTERIILRAPDIRATLDHLSAAFLF
jgi:hypothetical protein